MMTKQNTGARHAPATFSEAEWIAGFKAMGGDPDANVEFAIYASYEVIFSEAASPEPSQAIAGAGRPQSGG